MKRKEAYHTSEESDSRDDDRASHSFVDRF